ncbi:MAG: alpha/beta hydrolase [Pseudomonadota bacterium]
MEINGKELVVDDFGEGEVLLCVHGLGGTSNFWRPVIAAFADRYRVVVPDLPSSGRSANDPQLSISSLCADLLALMDALRVRDFHLLGHSMGTIVCQHLAVAAPDRVKDLVLLGPLAEPPEPAREAIAQRAESARQNGMEAIANTIADVALAAETKREKPNAQAFVREMLLRQSPEGYAQSCIALAEANAADAASIAAPVLLITGDQDGVAPGANVSILDSALPDSEFHVLSHCGHWTLTERDEEVIPFIEGFYK